MLSSHATEDEFVEKKKLKWHLCLGSLLVGTCLSRLACVEKIYDKASM